MADPKLALFLALAWFLLAGPFPKGEATGPRCKKQPARERKATLEIFHWQEAYLPLAVIVGGCCGLVWWVLLVIYDVSQKGGQKGLPQISGEVDPVELVELVGQKTTDLEPLEEWGDRGIRLECRVVSKGAASAPVELEPCPPCQPQEQSPPSQPKEESPPTPSQPQEQSPPSPPKEESPPAPSQPKEQSPTSFWTYLEQELERILLAVRSYRTTGPQSPVPEEKTNNLPVEKLEHLLGDWRSILAQFKQLPLFVQGQSCPAVDKQEPLPKEERQSSPVQEKQQPLTKEGHSSLAEGKKSTPSRKKHVSLAKERKKSPRRARSRSKSRCRACSSSKPRKRSSSRSRSSSGSRSSSRCRGPCSKLCSKRK